MHMQQPSSITTAATKQINNSQMMIPTYGSTFESLNARDSSYDGRLAVHMPKPSGGVSDRINVRIRGKNNAVANYSGSVTRTMDEMGEERKRK